MSSNDIDNHSICGNAAALVPPAFRAEFAKTHNVAAPLLLCDTTVFKDTLRKMTAALPEGHWQYAMKTNDTLPLLAIVMQEGHGFDCSSVGEIQRVYEVAKALDLDLEAIMATCSYGNPNKKTQDIADAYALGVRSFSLDSKEEVDKIAAVARGAAVYLRTFVDATQATAISVFTNKFGAPASTIAELAAYAKQKGLKPYGVGLSVGGGQTNPDAFALGVKIAGGINQQCNTAGVTTMTGITFCGGLPAQTAPGAPSFKTIGERIREACAKHGIAPKDVTFEPGRGLATSCGIIEAKVITLKTSTQDGEPATLVLNIGPFKGLFEMERTNLTYKLAAYYDHSAEMIPCRIVDDTCDSKGVCFKEQQVLMPSSLEEGSRVYFLNTGSYTTAYVMENFNRTLPLTVKCFPDPFAKLANLPAWLKGVETPGQAAHRGKNLTQLWSDFRKLQTDGERVEFLKSKVAGSGTLGISLLPSHMVKRFRELNSAIVNHTPDQPGADHLMSFQLQSLFQNIWEGWVANSAILTINSWQGFSNITTRGGAKAYLCFQNQYRSTVRHCTLLHATLVVVPNDTADGPPKFIEVNYNPYTIDGLNKDVLDRAFGNALRNEKVYRDPEGSFEQVMVGSKLLPAFANADLVWTGSLHDREPLAVYWPDATEKDGIKRPIDLEGALVFDLNSKQHSTFSQVESFSDLSYLAGYGVSNRDHIDGNSCLRTTIRILTLALLGKDKHFGEDWSTDLLIEHLAKLAPRRLWTDTPGHSIRNLGGFEKDSKSVEVGEFVGNIQSILLHPTMMQSHGDENAYNTDYMGKTTVPHPEYPAQQLYEAAAKLALNLLEEKADYMGAIAGIRAYW